MKTLEKKIRNVLTLITMMMLALVVTGCSDDDDNPIAPDMGSGASIRVVHASPDAPAVDIYAVGAKGALINDLGYGQASDYLDVEPGSYQFEVRAAGQSQDSPPAFTTGVVEIPAGATITTLAVGLLGSGDLADKFRVVPLVENFAMAEAGQAVVRIYHGASDAPTVALDVGNDGTPEIAGFARWAESGEAGVALPAGAPLQIGIWAGNPLARVTAFTVPALPAGAELFVIATGLLGKLPRQTDGFALLAVGPAGSIGLVRQNPVVFALHASPDAPAVDIAAGSTVLVPNLAFGQISAPVQVPPGEYTLGFQAAGSGSNAAAAMTPPLQAGERYLAVASGFLLDNPAFTLLPYGEGFGTTAYDALVRAVHASPDAPPVDLGLWDGVDFTTVAPFADLEFGEASVATGTEVGTMPFTLGIAATGSKNPVATFDLAAASGMRLFAVAAGSLTGKPGAQAFRLLLVDTQSFPWTVAAQVFPNPPALAGGVKDPGVSNRSR